MKIFAYGALMSLQHLKKFGISYSLRIPVTAKGYTLHFEKVAKDHPQKGWANIAKGSNTDVVHGILYDIPGEGIAIIDVLEDYPHGYTRELITVTRENGQTIDAFAYIAHPEMIAENLLPTMEYVELLCESEDMLPPGYIQTLRLARTLESLDSQ